MKPENPKFPEWANRDREMDLEWIRVNTHIFRPAARSAFAELGRGAIVVDTTSRPTGAGNPFGYLPQDVFVQSDDEDTKRILREYDPTNEFVVVVLKPQQRTSTYRIQIRKSSG